MPLANRLGFIDEIRTLMGEIKQAKEIAIKAVSACAVGMVFLKISREIAVMNHPDSLVQVFYGYAAVDLSAEFYNSKHHDDTIITSYREAVDESWNRVINLKNAVDRNGEDQEDVNYCLGLEKKVGDEIEKMYSRLLQLHSHSHVFPGISYIPDERSKIPVTPH